MTRQDAASVAKILRELAQRMELEGGNPYRARAYAKAADNLALSPLPLDQLIAEEDILWFTFSDARTCTRKRKRPLRMFENAKGDAIL